MLAVLVVLALSDVAVTVLGAIAVAVIGGPLGLVLQKVLKHDSRDAEVADAIRSLGTQLTTQDGKIDGVVAGLTRVEGRLDAHIDGRLVLPSGGD